MAASSSGEEPLGDITSAGYVDRSVATAAPATALLRSPVASSPKN